MVGEHFLHRYGYGVDYVATTNLVIDYMMTKEPRQLRYNYRSAERILGESPKDTDIKVKEISILTDGYAEKIFADIVEKLS